MKSNPTLETIFNRCSIRKYDSRPVSEEDLDIIIRAGMAAPTAKNTQPWEFIIVRDRDRLNRLADGLPYAKMLFHAPAAIIVCGNMKHSIGGYETEYSVIDSCCASQNILLAIESLGLGAVWTAVYPRENRVAIVKEVLEIPEHIIPLNVIALGYPAEKKDIKDKYKVERIHFEKWQGME